VTTDAPKTYSIGELVEAAGVTRRTVRYYVQRRLIDPPEGSGRGSAYTERHLAQIHRVRALQREGLELDAIQRLPAQAKAALPAADPHAPALLVRIPLAAGVRLELDAGVRVPGRAVLAELRAACARILERDASREHDERSADSFGAGSLRSPQVASPASEADLESS
jgi:DNA-binding transcriptional MerR regulator